MSIEGQPRNYHSVYNGFSAPASRIRRGPSGRAGKILLGGAAAAAVIGVAFGLLAKPDIADEDGLKLKNNEVVQIQVGPGRAPVVPGAPVRAAPLQTLPAGAATPNVLIVPAAAGVRAAPRRVPAVATAPQAARPSYDCRYARTPAERMICEDASLAAADRRLADAYGRAVAAGIPQRRLRSAQDRWLEAREAAAADSPDSVAEVYDERTAELEALAQDEEYRLN